MKKILLAGAGQKWTGSATLVTVKDTSIVFENEKFDFSSHKQTFYF